MRLWNLEIWPKSGQSAPIPIQGNPLWVPGTEDTEDTTQTDSGYQWPMTSGPSELLGAFRASVRTTPITLRIASALVNRIMPAIRGG